MIVLVEPGIGEENALIVNAVLLGDADFFSPPESFLSCPAMKDVFCSRHVKDSEKGPEILDQRNRCSPDRNTCLKIRNPVQGIINPHISFSLMGIAVILFIAGVDLVIGECSVQAALKRSLDEFPLP
jgi:hypothetical protein